MSLQALSSPKDLFDEHHRAAQARAALPVVLRAEVVEIYFAGAKTVCILRYLAFAF